MCMQNFNKLHQKLFKLQSRNQVLMDRQMDRHKEENYHPNTIMQQGIKKKKTLKQQQDSNMIWLQHILIHVKKTCII